MSDINEYNLKNPKAYNPFAATERELNRDLQTYIKNTKWDRVKRRFPHDDATLYMKPLNKNDPRSISITLMNQGINRGYIWFIDFSAIGYERHYYIKEGRKEALSFVLAHRNDPKYWDRVPIADKGEVLYRGVPFPVLRDNGVAYIQAYNQGTLGAMWFTKKELDAALSRAERFRKKYGWK